MKNTSEPAEESLDEVIRTARTACVKAVMRGLATINLGGIAEANFRPIFLGWKFFCLIFFPSGGKLIYNIWRY